jgi:hypothetical protein
LRAATAKTGSAGSAGSGGSGRAHGSGAGGGTYVAGFNFGSNGGGGAGWLGNGGNGRGNYSGAGGKGPTTFGGGGRAFAGQATAASAAAQRWGFLASTWAAADPI